MIYLVVGSTGAGKTTYSYKLSQDLPAVVYSIDHWMKKLYWPDMPTSPDIEWFQNNHQWYMDRIHRCENMILESSLSRCAR